MWLFKSEQVSAVQVVKQIFLQHLPEGSYHSPHLQNSISFSETCDQIKTVKLSAIITSATQSKQGGVRWGQKLP